MECIALILTVSNVSCQPSDAMNPVSYDDSHFSPNPTQVSVYLAAPPILFSPPTFLPSILWVHSPSPFSESILRVYSPSLSSPLCLPHLHGSNHHNMTSRLALLPSTTLRRLNQLAKEYVQGCNGHDHLKYARFCQETELSRKNQRKLGLGFRDTIQFWQL